MDFPNYSSIFGGTTGSTAAKTAAGASMWPLALASLGSSALSGVFGGLQSGREVDAQFQIAAAQQKEASRARGMAGMQSMFNTLVAPAVQYQWDKKAKETQLREFAPWEGLLESQSRRRAMRDMLSPEGQELFQREKKADLDQALVERQAQLAGLFGPTATFAKTFS